MAVVEIEIPPRSPYVGVVRLAISSLARSVGLDEEKIDDLKIAVSEVCTNAVLAHEESGTDHPITVSWSESDRAIEVDVDQATVSAADAPAADSQGFSTRRMLSTALLESLMDELDYRDRPGGGTRTHLAVRRSV